MVARYTVKTITNIYLLSGFLALFRYYGLNLLGLTSIFCLFVSLQLLLIFFLYNQKKEKKTSGLISCVTGFYAILSAPVTEIHANAKK